MEPRRLRLLCLSLVVVRCQPLRRALAFNRRFQYVAICR
ncbi:C4-dicarboxylate ABC transporter [Vibrio cholerae]|nr:C4-dicarboxylate ABC transporter [Vibrio cholerae]